MPLTRYLRGCLAGIAMLFCGGMPRQLDAQTPIRPPIRLADVLSAPFPSAMTPAPRGRSVAWVYNAQGTRNIWVATASASGAFRSRALTRYTGDDGMELGEIAWTGDATAIVFSRGGTLEGGGPVNPSSLAAGPPAQEIWSCDLASGALRSIGPGKSPAASPVGMVIAFVRDGQIWLVDLAKLDAARAVVSDRGGVGGLAWSPDGTRIAFTSHRGNHDLLGIYDLRRAAITWMAPSVDRDSEPVWSADSRRIAWFRVPSEASPDPDYDDLQMNREGAPWSIWIGDPDTGAAAPRWIAPRGPGSVLRRLDGGRSLLWTRADALVFPWEWTGWLRLYAVSAGGAAGPVALTPDKAEVFAAGSGADGLVFASNAGDDDRRHLWMIAAGAAARRLTPGDGIEDLPMIGQEGDLFALHATAQAQMAPVVVAGSGVMTPLAPQAMPATFPATRLVIPERVTFQSPDGQTIHGQMFMPDDHSSGKRPAILYFHGGPQRQMLLGWHPMGSYSNMYAMNQYLASRGYVVLSVNYRGGTGYGLNFREAERFSFAGGSEAIDIAGAVAFLKTLPGVDQRRIGAWGLSYGGLMTAMGLSRMPDAFAAGVDIAGVHDWRSLLPALGKDDISDERGKLAFQSSPISTVDAWRAPVLLVHADDDRIVDFDQTTELVRALRIAGKVEPAQMVVPNENHVYLRQSSWLSVFSATAAFFDKHLKNEIPPR